MNATPQSAATPAPGNPGDATAGSTAVAWSGTDDPRIEPGRRHGKYVFGEVLGRGVMGVVHRATDETLGREVAVKLPSVSPVTAAESVERLHREARAVAALSHPGLCRIHEVFRVDGRPAIAMELVEGRQLSEIIEEDGPLEPRRAAAIAADVADALHAAHEAGIVHRDVKPANIVIRGDGRPVLLDFGLVWLLERAEETRLTQDGTAIGSPAYMSPEQVSDAEVGPASDQYNLGVTLYEMLTGTVPFRGTIAEVIGQALHTVPVGVRSVRRSAPRSLEDLCGRALRKRPGRRFASMAEFRDRLAAFAGRRPRTARQWASDLRHRHGRRFAAAAVLSLCGAAAAWRFWPTPPPGPHGQDALFADAAAARWQLAATVARLEGAGADEPFETFDLNADDLLDHGETLAWVIYRADANTDGLVDRDEYADGLRRLGKNLFAGPSDAEWEEEVRQIEEAFAKLPPIDFPRVTDAGASAAN